MTIDNTAVQAIKADQWERYQQAMDAGYEDAGKPLPEWVYKPVAYWTLEQRGWFVGRELKMMPEVEE